ncbi:MAG: hypothetical protein CVU56_03275 [Deltaproteobacteria bacterium HGW-Deltaproteobacteria-14]|jgi:hypothetical protein|nr:MAG: hypothetical protein CVU56_03275 [Deltaproteobacteria bacterium HGW-Deltaproteobacteria-14]
MKLTLLPLLLILPLGAACGDTSTTGIGLEFSPYVDGGASNLLILGPAFEVTRFEVLVREIKVLPDDTTDATKYKAKGQFYVNVLDPTANTTPIYDLSAGTYKKVEFKFDTPDTGTGLLPANSAIVLEATIDGVDVQYLATKLDKVTLRDVSGIPLGAGDVDYFLVDLDIIGWFGGVDVTTLALTDGVAVIDNKGANKDAWNAITENIKTEIKMLRKPQK